MRLRLPRGLFRLLITLAVCASTLLLMLSLRAPNLQTQTEVGLLGKADADDAATPASVSPFVSLPIAASEASPTESGPTGAKEAGSSPIAAESLAFIINEPDVCRVLRPDVFALIYVHTAPSHFKHRAVIRRTYGNTGLYSKLRTVTVFFVGRTEDPEVELGLLLESQRYHDVVQANYLDTYRNLSLKAVSALKWIRDHCGNARFVLKADDDMFVNVFNLVRHLNVLQKYQTTEDDDDGGVIHCLVWYNMGVIREAKSKWYVSPEEYANKTFPTYCSGSAFFMPAAVAPLLYEASLRAPFLWVDDAYATGVLAKHGGVKHNSISSIVVLKPEDYEAKLISGEAVFGHMAGDKGVDLRHSYWKKVLKKEVADVVLDVS